jgi:hypothetical protein
MGDVMHNNDADSEACLNQHILNISFKRKAQDDECDRPLKLIYKELRSQYLNTFTYKYIRNINRNTHTAGIRSRNTHTARAYQLISFPTDIEEIHEALYAV